MPTGYRGDRRGATWPGLNRKLRRDSTDAERRLWHHLRNRQLAGTKFRRQHQFGRYVLDFFSAEANLAIECDGSQHLSSDGAARDRVRDEYLRAKGLRVLRFTNDEILTNTEGDVIEILRTLEEPSP